MGVDAKRIRLCSVEIINDDTFVYHYKAGSFMRRFLANEPLWVRYEGSVREIPPGIAAIPFVGIMSQIIWFYGGILDIPELDTTYAESMNNVKAVFQALHPAILLSGRVNTGKKTSVASPNRQRNAAFFTGGIDSMATALRHREENLLLISIWGSEARVHQEKAWQQVSTAQAAAAAEMGLERTVIASNYQEILQQWALDFYFPGRLLRSWFVEVAYGSIFLGLSAPIAWREGIGTVYIASSYTAENWPPDGSYPALIEKTQWSGTQAVYDAGDENRQVKTERIIAAIRGSFPGLKLNVCPLGKEEGNCSLCEKCSRTIAGLALMGIDPKRHGFVITANTPGRIRRALEQNEWRLTVGWQPSSVKFWREIQEKVPRHQDTALPEWRDFFKWFSGFDVNGFIWKPPLSLRKEIKNMLAPRFPFSLYIAKRLLIGVALWRTRRFGQ